MRVSAIGFVAPLALVAVADAGNVGALDDPVGARVCAGSLLSDAER